VKVPDQPLPLVVLISGGGTNLQAIIDAAAADLPVDIRAVISNEADAFGLERARRAGIETRVLDHRAFADREAYDVALATLIDEYEPGLVVLAGFMRILTAGFVRHFHGRMLNIHPSLLPRYRGLDTHARVLAAGDREHGATVHFVTEELDGGPLIVQARVPVLANDDPQALAHRVLEKEHLIYPAAIRWFAQGRLRLDEHRVMLDGTPLTAPVDPDLPAPEV
jgi:phosphoribosylglycinamide formyltransferase-1